MVRGELAQGVPVSALLDLLANPGRFFEPRPPGYPLPTTPDGIAFWQINLALADIVPGWAGWQAQRQMAEIVPVIKRAMASAPAGAAA